MMLAYFVVESERLSKNPVFARVILAVADTMLEVAGANAGLFISNPQTKAIVESLIDEFAIKRDFDDDDGETILRSLLGSAIVAVAENPGRLAAKPALKPLFAAIADVRKEMDGDGADFVAGIVSADGFPKLVGAYLTHAAEDPSFITKNEDFQEILKATMLKAAEVLPESSGNPEVLIGILEAALGAAATNVESILDKKIGSDPLLSAVLKSVAKEVAEIAQNNTFVDQITEGSLIPGIFRTALTAVAESPDLIMSTAKVNDLTAKLIAGVAGSLAAYDPNEQAPDLWEDLAGRALNALASEPSLLGKNREFANNILAAVFSAAAAAGKDGFSLDDIESVAKAALKKAAESVALLDLDTEFGEILKSAGLVIAKIDFKKLQAKKGARDAFLAVVSAVAANPAVWKGFKEAGLVVPIFEAVLDGLSNDPGKLFSGPKLTDAMRQVLQLLALKGNKLIDGEIENAEIKALLTKALNRSKAEIGKSIDGENVTLFLVRVLDAFLEEPFSPVSGAKLTSLLTDNVQRLAA